jgi:hypothetical protein
MKKGRPNKNLYFLKYLPLLFFFFPQILHAERDSALRGAVMEAALYATETKLQSASQIRPSSNNSDSYLQDTEELSLDEEVSEEQTEASKSTFYLSAGHDANHLHYKEYSGKDTLDEDYGKLRGFYVSLGYKGGHNLTWLMESKPFIEGYFRRYDALVTYDGATNLGTPLSFKEKAEVQRFGVKLGGYHSFSNKKEGLFYIDIGNRTWYRGENEVIQGALAYAERYRWTYFGLGGGINYKLLPQVSIGLDIEGMCALDSKMRADLYEGGTFKLKGVAGWELKLPIKYYLLKNISLDVTPYSTWWNITESDPVLISGKYYYEPNSHTHIEGLLVGITCRL